MFFIIYLYKIDFNLEKSARFLAMSTLSVCTAIIFANFVLILSNLSAVAAAVIILCCKKTNLQITTDVDDLQLRYLQTLNSISAEKNSTIVFPVPIDIISKLMQNSYRDNNDQRTPELKPGGGGGGGTTVDQPDK